MPDNANPPTPRIEHGLTKEQQREQIADLYADIMKVLGLDLTDESLKDTPKRVAKMYVNEIFAGLHQEEFPRIMTVPNDMNYNQILLMRNIKVHTVCEHHIQPIIGFAHIAYIPKPKDKGGKVLGLSKFNRVVDYYARRPQVQERLTEQIFNKLVEVLGTEDVAVIIDARHYCIIARGVEDQNSSTVTSKLGGSFRTPETRKELMDLIHRPNV